MKRCNSPEVMYIFETTYNVRLQNNFSGSSTTSFNANGLFSPHGDKLGPQG
jgi:hypothetical protein